MEKTAYFASEGIDGWPRPRDIERYFLAPPGHRWFFETGNDGAYFLAEGVDGTEHLSPQTGRTNIKLYLWGNEKFGVLLTWSKLSARKQESYSSKGDLTRLREFVRTTHGDQMPIGLYVPFAIAWKAVKEFLETDGALPKSIEWINDRDLPPNTFPKP